MTETSATANAWSEIATGFLKVGATAYGGPAIMGVMLIVWRLAPLKLMLAGSFVGILRQRI